MAVGVSEGPRSTAAKKEKKKKKRKEKKRKKERKEEKKIVGAPALRMEAKSGMEDRR